MNQSKPTIAYILPTLAVGGAERLATEILKRLATEAVPVLILLKPSRPEAAAWLEASRLAGVAVYEVANPYERTVWKLLGRPWHFVRLWQLLRRLKPQVVHTHLFLADVLGRPAAWLAGVPVIVSTEHNVVFSAETRWQLWVKCLTNRLATRIVAVSAAVADYLVQGEGVTRERIEVIHNGIEPEKFSAIQTGAPPRLVIGSLGRLTRQKGLDVLLEALAELKAEDFTCRLAGGSDPAEPETAADLAARIERLRLQGRVELVGVQPAERFLADLDIFVLPSRWEGLPLVLLEAGAAGLPVVATAVGGSKEVIETERTGLLVPAEDSRALAQALRRLLHDPELRRRLGQANRQRIAAQFSLAAVTLKYLELYRRLASR